MEVPMSGGSTPYKTISPLRLVATFCVLAPMVAVIAVPTYNSATPKLGGFPFYYWYQLLLVVITGVLMVGAFWAIRIDEGRRRRARAADGPSADGLFADDADDDTREGGA
jgi:Protein of unknown function (DUF3311)